MKKNRKLKQNLEMNNNTKLESGVSATKTNDENSEIGITIGIIIGVIVILAILIFFIRYKHQKHF